MICHQTLRKLRVQAMLRKMVVTLAAAFAILLAGPTRARSQQPQTIAESEPNDTPAAANKAALGDSVRGTISARTDFDYFAVDIPAGTFVRLPPATTLKVCLLDRDGLSLLICNDAFVYEGHPFYGGLGFPFTTGG